MLGLFICGAATLQWPNIPDYAYQNYSSGAGPSAATSGLKVQNRALKLRGQPLLVRGVTYSPTPIGVDLGSFAAASMDFFVPENEAVWRRDLPLMQQAGMNTIRLYELKESARHAAFLDLALALNLTILAGFPLDRRRDRLRIASELEASAATEALCQHTA
jgi:hypothetical protein